MKIKELIKQLSEYNSEAEIEFLYSFYTLDANNNTIHARVVEKDFYLVPSITDNKMNVESIILATNQSLIND